MRKYTCLLIFVVIASVMAAGCASSDNSGVKDVKTSESPSAKVVAPAAQAPVYEDDQWIGDNQKFCKNFALDFQNIGQDANNGDLDSLYYAAMQAKEDLHGVLEADPLYNVSPKYAYARSEWINGLEDSENAVDLIIACKNGSWADNQKMVSRLKLKDDIL